LLQEQVHDRQLPLAGMRTQPGDRLALAFGKPDDPGANQILEGWDQIVPNGPVVFDEEGEEGHALSGR
jgi:hypothetical protein